MHFVNGFDSDKGPRRMQAMFWKYQQPIVDTM